MNAPSDDKRDDDKTLDEYLQRESAVSQQYRNIESHDVPPALDSAVLAQAKEVLTKEILTREALMKKASRKPAWTRWSAPIALAASLVLGIAVVLELGVDEKVSLPAVQLERTAAPATAVDASAVEAIDQVTEQPLADKRADTSLSAPKLDAPAAPSSSDRMFKRSESPVRADAQKREATPAPQAAAESDNALARSEPPAPQLAAAPPPVAQLKEQIITTAARRAVAPAREAEERRRDPQFSANSGFAGVSGEVAPYATTATRQTSGPAPAVVNRPQQVQPLTQSSRLQPVPWLEQIRALRRDGKVLEADEQWRQFSEAYPDYEVAADDRARPKP
jgi:hypothetical protein